MEYYFETYIIVENFTDDKRYSLLKHAPSFNRDFSFVCCVYQDKRFNPSYMPASQINEMIGMMSKVHIHIAPPTRYWHMGERRKKLIFFGRQQNYHHFVFSIPLSYYLK